MRAIDISGKRFGRILVLKYVGNSRWLCRCDCSNEKIIRRDALIQGRTKSCGCFQKEIAAKQVRQRSLKHGDFGTKLYGIWAGMKRRCYNPRTKYYEDYGGRGITVCDEWKNDYSKFKEWALANGYQEGLSIERVDVNKGYSPDNCKFITINEQNSNKRISIRLQYQGKEYSIKELSKLTGIKERTIRDRYERGLPIEEILNPKIRKNQYC